MNLTVLDLCGQVDYTCRNSTPFFGPVDLFWTGLYPSRVFEVCLSPGPTLMKKRVIVTLFYCILLYYNNLLDDILYKHRVPFTWF